MGFTLIIAMTKRKNNNSGMESLFAAIETNEPQAEPWFMKADIPPTKPFEQVLAEVEEMNRQYREQTQGDKPLYERTTSTDYTVEECVRNLKFAGKRILELQFSNRGQGIDFFKHIVYEKKVETRQIYPNNSYKYVTQQNGRDVPRVYDYLYLINGRRNNSPRVLVSVDIVRTKIVEEFDKKGNPIYYTNDDGKKYLGRYIAYALGKVIKTENL